MNPSTLLPLFKRVLVQSKLNLHLVASGSRLVTALKGKYYTLAIMPEKDKLHNYVYRPRSPTTERWFSTTTGCSPDQNVQRHAGVKGKEYAQGQLRHMEE